MQNNMKINCSNALFSQLSIDTSSKDDFLTPLLSVKAKGTYGHTNITYVFLKDP